MHIPFLFSSFEICISIRSCLTGTTPLVSNAVISFWISAGNSLPFNCGRKHSMTCFSLNIALELVPTKFRITIISGASNTSSSSSSWMSMSFSASFWKTLLLFSLPRPLKAEHPSSSLTLRCTKSARDFFSDPVLVLLSCLSFTYESQTRPTLPFLYDTE